MAVVRGLRHGIRGHGCLQGREIHGNRNGTTPLTLVSARRVGTHIRGMMRVGKVVVVMVVRILVQSHERSGCGEMIGLRCRTLDEGRRHGRSGHGKVIVGHAVLEGFQGDQFGELDAEHLGMTTQMVDQDLRGLLLLGEITTLVETPGVGGVHVEERRAVQFHDETTGSRGSPVRLRGLVTRFQSDVLDVGKGIFDLVAGGVVVDVVGHAGLFGRVENNQIHGILPNAAPTADGQGAASEVVDHWGSQSETCRSRSQPQTLELTNFTRGGGFTGVSPVGSITPCATKRIPCARLVWVELHGQILTHGFGNGITALTCFNALLG